MLGACVEDQIISGGTVLNSTAPVGGSGHVQGEMSMVVGGHRSLLEPSGNWSVAMTQ